MGRTLAILLLVSFASLAAASWVQSLESKGFTVQEGEYGFFDVDTCSHSDTCYAINPLTPYGLMYLSPHPNETQRGNYSNTCHKHKLCRRRPDGTVLSPTWRLAKGETVVLVGRTPPESTYFSFSNYLYTRHHPEGWRSNATLQRKIIACPAGPSRCEVFAGINDPLNMLTVETDGASPFNRSFSMILASDADAEDAVSAHLSSDAVGPVNKLRYPGAALHLGVTQGDEDELMNVMRLEGVKDPSARDSFYSSPPVRVYRVSPPPSLTVRHPFPSFQTTMRPRGTGVAEHGPNATNAQLHAGLKSLKAAVQAKHGTGVLKRDLASMSFNSFVKDSGYECLEDGTQCQGDCRDTIYAKGTMLIQEGLCNKTHLPCKPARHAQLTDSKGDSLYVLGVNHQLTSQSRYSTLTIYNYPKLASGMMRVNNESIYTEMETSKSLQGSAAKYLPSDHPATPYLYVAKFARRCDADDFDLCFEVLSESDDPSVLTIGLDSAVFLLERMYIHPLTKSGPAVNETILPILIHHKL